ncbi:MAG: type I restriction endonuclease subunit R [Bacteroidales bacterium]|nr:type I restriction endonuclease subunit R [Bacteroidales bacterium]
MAVQNEAALESGLIATLKSMNYEYVQIDEETNLKANFKKQLGIHNKKQLAEFGRTEFTDSEFEKILIYLEGSTRFEKAKKLRDLYPLATEDGKRIWVEFLNRTHWCQNEFQVSNQITIEGRKRCRYDVTLLINGLPLVQIELKRRGVELKQAYNQIQRYHKTSFHGLFDYIQLFVISNGVNTRYFANNPNSGYKFTFNWTDAANIPFNELERFAAFFFDKCTLGKLISKYIVLHEGDKCLMVLRPYQYYAVEKILDRVENSNDNGYIWHTTGAGKTLTSFKAAQLVSELPDVDKVMFVVDRHDLDTQTQSEYEAFEPGAVDGTDDTNELVKRLSGTSKIIITTIQKLNTAVTKIWYSNKIDVIRNSRIVMIFDECHRSHFGDSHQNIEKFFHNTQMFGFTGTPIFVENAVDNHTTKEIFGNCLHQYLIKDAIADENVLGFLVEYYKGNEEVNKTNDDRMHEIAKFILNNFNKSTFDGEFDALFAVQSVPMLIRYYKIFKELKPDIRIGAVFTYAANSSQDDDYTGMNKGFVSESVGEADDLQEIMDDYNRMYGTAFNQENFRAYYDDINLRMKKKRADMKSLDLCLVVGMFLTGFDSKKLNTLYVDKNMEYHGLLQAFSRTNRVLNEKKRFGKIVCFRDLKSNVDSAIKLFSNSNNVEDIVRPPFEKVKKEYVELATYFMKKYPEPSSIDSLQSENDKKDFIIAFRDIIKKHAEIQIYEDYNEDASDLGIIEQQFMDFRSKYLDIYEGFTEPNGGSSTFIDLEPPTDPDEPRIEDIDFCLELLHSDIINVAYILELIANLNPYSEDYETKRREIIDTMIKDAELRGKAKLIDGFIQKNVDEDRDNFMDNKQKADGSSDLEERLNNYISEERVKAITFVAQEEELNVNVLNHYLSEYDYLQKEQPEIIQKALKEKHLGLSTRRKTLDRILSKMRSIIKTFSWN